VSPGGGAFDGGAVVPIRTILWQSSKDS
jgi:hypothetical protein